MALVTITLKNDGKGNWYMVAPAGHTIGPRFRGSKFEAQEWARQFVSVWYNWIIKLEDNTGESYEKKD